MAQDDSEAQRGREEFDQDFSAKLNGKQRRSKLPNLNQSDDEWCEGFSSIQLVESIHSDRKWFPLSGVFSIYRFLLLRSILQYFSLILFIHATFS